MTCPYSYFSDPISVKVAGGNIWSSIMASYVITSANKVKIRIWFIKEIDGKFLYFSFPKNSGLVYSVMDATFGLGYTVGPVLGAFLYNLGGFLTPFLVCGLAMTGTGALCVWKCLPAETAEAGGASSSSSGDRNNQQSSSRILPVLLNPGMDGVLQNSLPPFFKNIKIA